MNLIINALLYFFLIGHNEFTEYINSPLIFIDQIK